MSVIKVVLLILYYLELKECQRDEKKIPSWIKMQQSCFLGWGSAKSEIIDYMKLSSRIGLLISVKGEGDWVK